MLIIEEMKFQIFCGFIENHKEFPELFAILFYDILLGSGFYKNIEIGSIITVDMNGRILETNSFSGLIETIVAVQIFEGKHFISSLPDIIDFIIPEAIALGKIIRFAQGWD